MRGERREIDPLDRRWEQVQLHNREAHAPAKDPSLISLLPPLSLSNTLQGSSSSSAQQGWLSLAALGPFAWDWQGKLVLLDSGGAVESGLPPCPFLALFPLAG